MDINLTAIVGVLGVLAALFFGFKGKLSGILSAKRDIHKKEQTKIEKEVDIVKKDIIKKEEEIKKLEEKSKKAEEVIQKIAASKNEEVKKILKEEDTKKLIDEFNKW
jgi:predicted  nucleic acid-binding Zn-ribbon protein